MPNPSLHYFTIPLFLFVFSIFNFPSKVQLPLYPLSISFPMLKVRRHVDPNASERLANTGVGGDREEDRPTEKVLERNL
jgi:hypothetical protein